MQSTRVTSTGDMGGYLLSGPLVLQAVWLYPFSAWNHQHVQVKVVLELMGK